MKFLSYIVVLMYLALNTSYAVLPDLQRALEKIKREDKKSAVEIISTLMDITVDGTANRKGYLENIEYAKILLNFILTGKLDDEKENTFYQTQISKEHFATEEERDILSIAIMKTACIDLSLEKFIEDVIAKEKKRHAKRHQKVVQQLFHLAGLMIKEPFMVIPDYGMTDFSPFYYNDIQTDPLFEEITPQKFVNLFKKNKKWIDEAIKYLGKGDDRTEKRVLFLNSHANVKTTKNDDMMEDHKKLLDDDNIFHEEREEYQRFLKNAEINVDRDYRDKWLDIIKFSYYPVQGWKIHVSANPHGATRVAKVVVPYLKRNKIASKIGGSLQFLKNLNYGRDSIAQRGKFITIYPEDDGDDDDFIGNNKTAAKIAHDLNDLLIDAIDKGDILQSDFEVIPYDARLGESGGLYVRYGLLQMGVYLKPIDSEGRKIEGRYVFDNRQGYYKPDFVTWNPFGDLLHEPQGY